MNLLHTFILYLYSVLDHWLFSFGGIALVVFALYEKYRQKITPSKWFWGLAALCIFIATFQAWSDEHQKRKEAAVYLIPDVPRLVPGGVAASPVWFPAGKTPQVSLVWGMFGKDPALNIREDIECFIVDDLTLSTQESTIDAFAQKWTSRKDFLSSTDNPSLFPEGPHYGGTCHSESVVSDDMRDDMANGRKFVYILAVSRFKDSMGEHEAHACKWLETHLSDSQEFFGYVAWHECNKYITQTDISDP
jgi:hypothetical protein